MFIYNNTYDFKEAVLTEDESPYKDYLGIIIEPPSAIYPNGKTIKDGILEQI